MILTSVHKSKIVFLRNIKIEQKRNVSCMHNLSSKQVSYTSCSKTHYNVNYVFTMFLKNCYTCRQIDPLTTSFSSPELVSGSEL